jgi:hypothetical protein
MRRPVPLLASLATGALALAAAGASVVLAPVGTATAASVKPIPGIRSPSGNIRCLFVPPARGTSAPNLLCTIGHADYSAALQQRVHRLADEPRLARLGAPRGAAGSSHVQRRHPLRPRHAAPDLHHSALWPDLATRPVHVRVPAKRRDLYEQPRPRSLHLPPVLARLVARRRLVAASRDVKHHPPRCRRRRDRLRRGARLVRALVRAAS